MFKSKKRLLMVLGSVAAVAGVAAAALVIHHSDLFGDAAPQQASASPDDSLVKPGDTSPTTPGDPIKPPAPGEFNSSSSRFAASGTGQYGSDDYSSTYGSPPRPSTVSPASYPPPGDSTVVRGNDDGSFHPTNGADVSGADELERRSGRRFDKWFVAAVPAAGIGAGTAVVAPSRTAGGPRPSGQPQLREFDGRFACRSAPCIAKFRRQGVGIWRVDL